MNASNLALIRKYGCCKAPKFLPLDVEEVVVKMDKAELRAKIQELIDNASEEFGEFLTGIAMAEGLIPIYHKAVDADVIAIAKVLGK